MFALIEYTDYRKEGNLMAHGYATSEAKAAAFAKRLMFAKHKGDCTVEPLDVIEKDPYVEFGDTSKGKIISRYRATQWFPAKVAECEQVCAHIVEESEDLKEGPTKFSEITVENILGYFEVSAEHAVKVKEKFPLAEVVGNNMPRCQELFDLLIVNNYGHDTNREDHMHGGSMQVYAVVKVELLEIV